MAASYRHYLKLFRVHADGSGMPEPLPLPAGEEGSFSPDGQSLAYEPVTKSNRHGSATTAANHPIWIVNLKTLDLVKCPARTPTTPTPSGLATRSTSSPTATAPSHSLRYDTVSKQVSQVEPNHGFDLKSFPGRPRRTRLRAVRLHSSLDTATKTDQALSIQIHGELPSLSRTALPLRPDEIQNADLSPTGARAVFEAHGEIFTVPGEKGDTRNLTNTPGTAERDPSWSPDGKTIAYFSDASGEYQLYLHDQTGFKPPVVIDLGPDPSYFYNPTWSPDSKHIAYSDKHLHLWYVDVRPSAPAPKPVLVDSGIYGSFGATSARSGRPIPSGSPITATSTTSSTPSSSTPGHP
jgi:tricorn protease